MNFKLLLYSVLVFVVLGMSPGCKDVEIPGGSLSAYDKVYMPSAVTDRNKVELQLKDSVQSFVFGAAFGGYGWPSSDITVDFTVVTDSVVVYNQKYGTAYPVLPDGTYTLDKTTATIAKGGLSTEPLHVNVNPFGKLGRNKTYLLPITINKVTDGFTINPLLKTTYFLVKAK
jgi:hypothetical protein